MIQFFAISFKELLAPLATVIAAICATAITWRIQRENLIVGKNKLKLDLFDKRFSMYIDLRDRVFSVIQDPSNAYSAIGYIAQNESRIKFLFGNEVLVNIFKLKDSIGKVYVGSESMKDLRSDQDREERQKFIEMKYKGLNDIIKTDFEKIFVDALDVSKL